MRTSSGAAAGSQIGGRCAAWHAVPACRVATPAQPPPSLLRDLQAAECAQSRQRPVSQEAAAAVLAAAVKQQHSMPRTR